MIERENSSPKTAEQEAASILKQVERDSQSIIFGGMHAAPSPGDDAPEGDPIEYWGRRIGRTLGVMGAVLAAIWLLTTLG